ncbi:hypothetical protein [Planktothricoides sp. SR001]|uniref:hypothetical protein n=1 Tax=Planktothricoides sp. SR001 TaxID=1705388 RepID=UPI0012E23659|nr:hypothetical protein [Planktothricoides sp. SR001]
MWRPPAFFSVVPEKSSVSRFGLPDGGVANRGIKKHPATQRLARPGQSQDLFCDDCIIAFLATDSQKFPAIAVHHPRPKPPKKAPFLRLIKFAYLSIKRVFY